MEKTMLLESWDAPLKDVAAFNQHGIQLEKKKWEAGDGIYGGAYGYTATIIDTEWEENILHIDGRIWMSDAPHNQLTIAQDMEWARGERILLGGLGLGLHLRELIRVGYSGRVVVVELHQRVIDAILPTIPELHRLNLVVSNKDFWDECSLNINRYDCIHWDCYPGDSDYREAVQVLGRLWELNMKAGSNCNLIFHGAPELNIFRHAIKILT